LADSPSTQRKSIEMTSLSQGLNTMNSVNRLSHLHPQPQSAGPGM